ncbi:MAG TPA: hypothetical protein PLW86_11270 [Rhodocyclaceae bacterium]|nr:hypothetical protein [Rhodocyclaceae bacterium]
MSKIIACLFVIASLAGCANFNVKESYKLSSGEKKGLLVMSLFDTMNEPAMLDYRPFGSLSKDYDLSIMIGNIQDPPDWKNPRGRLVVAEIPAGKYEFFRWRSGRGSFTTYESVQPFSIPFTISEGKATYIGSVMVDVRESTKKFKLSVTDGSERDLSLLRQRFRNIEASDIRLEISPIQ